MESDICSETRGDFKCLLVAILQAQRQEDEEADEDAAKEQAQELYDAGEDRWGTDETAFTFILARRSWIQLRFRLTSVYSAYTLLELLYWHTKRLQEIHLKKQLSQSARVIYERATRQLFVWPEIQPSTMRARFIRQ